MLIIKPIQDKSYQEEMCKMCGFKYDPLKFAYSENENGLLVAGCQFDILGKMSVISDFGMVNNVPEDIEALIILGRAVLNFMELSGAKFCSYVSVSENTDRYAKMLGFSKNDCEWSIDLEGLFDSKCSHKCN